MLPADFDARLVADTYYKYLLAGVRYYNVLLYPLQSGDHVVRRRHRLAGVHGSTGRPRTRADSALRIADAILLSTYLFDF